MGDRNESGPVVPLVRRRLSDEWFDDRVSHSSSEPSFDTVDDSGEAHALVARRTWVRGGLAGAFVGAVAAATTTAIIPLAGIRLGTPIALARFLGEAVSAHRVSGDAAEPFGWCAAIGFGLILGAIVGTSTRHLHRMRAMVMFGLIFVPATWMVVRVLLLPRIRPASAAMLPFGATMIGAAIFGVLLSLMIPLRRGPR